MFMATGDDIPLNLMAVDPNAVVNNDAKIPGDPVAVVASNGTSGAGDMLPETSASRALHVLDTTIHRRTPRGQVPPGLQRRLPVGTPLPPAT